MAKLVTNPLTSLANQTAAIDNINGNMELIETALENTLSRDGTSPNEMEADLDMNSHRIANLPAPIALTEPVRLQDVTDDITVNIIDNSNVVSPYMVTLLNDVNAAQARTTLGIDDLVGISVKDYGAVGDGVTDDTVAIQAAIDDNPIGVLLFPAGDYIISDTLLVTTGIKMFGEGDMQFHDVGSDEFVTRLNWDGAAGGTMVHCEPVNGVSAQRISGGAMKGIGLLGNSVAGKGLVLRSVGWGDYECYSQGFIKTSRNVTAITQANPAVVTTSVAHTFETGDTVLFRSVGGMTQLNGHRYVIEVLTSTTFRLLGIDSTSYGAYTAGGTVATGGYAVEIGCTRGSLGEAKDSQYNRFKFVLKQVGNAANGPCLFVEGGSVNVDGNPSKNYFDQVLAVYLYDTGVVFGCSDNNQIRKLNIFSFDASPNFYHCELLGGRSTSTTSGQNWFGHVECSGQGLGIIAHGTDVYPVASLGNWLDFYDLGNSAPRYPTEGPGAQLPSTIGGATGQYPLVDYGSAILNQKLLLYHAGLDRYGLGMAGGEMRIFSADNGAVNIGEIAISDGETFTSRLDIDNLVSTFSHDVQVNGLTGTASFVNISNNAGFPRALRLQTGGVDRWRLQANTTAESGANAGSNFIINRFDDAGSSLGTALAINRATGIVTLQADITPAVNDVGALGSATLSFADLFLATGGTINWNNGDVLLTHAADTLTLSGGRFIAIGTIVPIESSRTDDTAAVEALRLASQRATPTSGDNVFIRFQLKDSGGTNTEFARMTAVASDVTDTSEDGQFQFSVMVASALTSKFFIAGTSIGPMTNDGLALGTATLSFSDLFLASGAVTNWNNGDITLTHSADTLTFAGMTSLVLGSSTLTMGATLNIGTGVTTGSASIELGGARTGDGNAFIDFHATNATDFEFRIIRAAGAAGIATISQIGGGALDISVAAGGGITYTGTGAVRPSVNDGSALGTTALGWSDFFLAAGGVLNWNNGNATLTHTAGFLTSSVPLRATNFMIGTGTANAAQAPHYTVTIRNVNFNSANTDTQVTIPLPAGYTRYRFNNAHISGASASLTTATCGIFTATGGGGTALITSGTAITVSTASEDTNNNAQQLAALNSTTMSLTDTDIYFRVQTPQGSAATANVTFNIQPLS